MTHHIRPTWSILPRLCKLKGSNWKQVMNGVNYHNGTRPHLSFLWCDVRTYTLMYIITTLSRDSRYQLETPPITLYHCRVKTNVTKRTIDLCTVTSDSNNKGGLLSLYSLLSPLTTLLLHCKNQYLATHEFTLTDKDSLQTLRLYSD